MVKAFLLAALALVFIYGMEKISKDSLILLFPSDIVDLKDTGSPEAKISSRLLPDSLANLFSSMVKMTGRTNIN